MYEPLTGNSPSCRQRWCGPKDAQQEDPLFTLQTLENEKRTLTLARLGIEYDMKELEKEVERHVRAADDDMVRMCAARMVRLKARYVVVFPFQGPLGLAKTRVTCVPQV